MKQTIIIMVAAFIFFVSGYIQGCKDGYAQKELEERINE